VDLDPVRNLVVLDLGRNLACPGQATLTVRARVPPIPTAQATLMIAILIVRDPVQVIPTIATPIVRDPVQVIPTIATLIARARVESQGRNLAARAASQGPNLAVRVASLVLSHMDPVQVIRTVLVTPMTATPIVRDRVAQVILTVQATLIVRDRAASRVQAILHLLVRVICTVLVTPIVRDRVVSQVQAIHIVRDRVASRVQAIHIVRDRVASRVQAIHIVRDRAASRVQAIHIVRDRAASRVQAILHLLVRVIHTVLVTPTTMTTILTQAVLRVVDQVGVVRKAAARVEVLRSLEQAAQNLMQREI